MSSGFTKFAFENKYVWEDRGSVFFSEFPNGEYFATGEDVNGRRIRRAYRVNDMKDRESVWAMWNDFNGRWGLTRIYHQTENGRRLIYNQY